MTKETRRSASPQRRKRLTPKQRVLRKFPNAWAHYYAAKNFWAVFDGTSNNTPPFKGQEILGDARSAKVAWKLADMRIHL